jgi:ribA/ribD-fused uncharacterized protein
MEQQFTFFWKNRSPFTNWYPSIFTHNGITFTRGEQYMMYQKAILFGDTAVAEAILKTDSPAEQQSLGRTVSNYNDATWSAKRVDVMVSGLFEKFNQNPKLKEALLNTGTSTMVEASPVDRIWGIGLAEDHPDATNPVKWRGLNLLGIVLMKVRDKIKQQDGIE